jgi:hypothetical protein
MAMPRRKAKNQLLIAAQTYVSQHLPEFVDRPLQLRILDGPPGSPRYAATSEACIAKACPRGLTAHASSSMQCGVLDCPLRCSARLLLDRHGTVIQATISGIHWN